MQNRYTTAQLFEAACVPTSRKESLLNTRAVFVAIALSLALALGAQERDRAKVPDQYKWDLAPIYASDEAWRAAKDQFAKQIPSIEQYQGHLGDSAATMLAAAEKLGELNKTISRLYVYAALKSDQDTRNATYQGMKQQMGTLATQLNREAAYIDPEILKIDRAKVQSFLQQEPKLRVYEHYLDDLLRRQGHTLSEAEEKLVAEAGRMSDNSADTFGIFADADFPYPDVTLSDGRTVKLDKAAFNQYRGLPNRDDRRKVMDTFFNALGEYRNTFGSTLGGKIQKDIFYMKVRKYPTTLAATLDQSNIPTAVYTSLIDGVNANLATFHRYLGLRKRMLGLPDLHYYDLSTLAHELGHTMQSYFSNKAQPYATADYPTFVAEVASTFNEALLIDYMLRQIKDDRARLSLLGNYLEGIKGTMFRQTQFAEFELRAHEMAERGEPITGESLDKLNLEITRRYYGHDKGVCIVDDSIAHEWANVPHFYRNYYVFQYATSFTASAALSEKVLAGDKAATQKYLQFLSAGGSKYPIELLKDAGVDMTTSQPLQLTMQKMNRVMDEMEKLLAKMSK